MSRPDLPPSRKPIRPERKVGRGYWNTPAVGPIIPRLQQPQPKDAIGFHHIKREEDDDQ